MSVDESVWLQERRAASDVDRWRRHGSKVSAALMHTAAPACLHMRQLVLGVYTDQQCCLGLARAFNRTSFQALDPTQSAMTGRLMHPGNPLPAAPLHATTGSWQGLVSRCCGLCFPRCLDKRLHQTTQPGCGASWQRHQTLCTASAVHLWCVLATRGLPYGTRIRN